jgi:hypothetical protein
MLPADWLINGNAPDNLGGSKPILTSLALQGLSD